RRMPNKLWSVLAAVLVAASIEAQEKRRPVYACDGFAEPLSKPGVMELRRGRVLPLKGKLVAADGSFANNKVLKTPPVVSLTFKPASGPAVDRSEGLEVRDYGKGKSFVFDAEAHWKFDLGTGNLADDGNYTVLLVSGDPAEYTVDPACRFEFALAP
ncbi:MAG TPA: hypothetical protein VEU30_04650, partial [Thermoanaerobaculia bacterium]|nr:hypothetical protein [Thermoanaerobaculia bacterium]